MSRRGETTEETSRASLSSQTNAEDQPKRMKIIYIVYLIAALDITWMFLQFSVTPYLARKLGFNTLWFGYLQTMVGVIQLVGGPMFGRFGDIFGARAALSLACSATVVFFLLLAIADHPAMLFVHKLPTVFMHVLPDANRSRSIFNVGEITRLMKFQGVAPTFLVKIVAGLPSGIFQVMFSIIALDFFKLEPEQNGYLMAYFGIVQMVIQGGVIGRLTATYSENSLLLLSIGVSSLVGLAQAYMQNVFQFCLIVLPMMFSLSVFNVITDSMLTKSVPSSDTGTMMGLCSSVQSLLRTVGPTAGGFLYMNYGISSIGLIQFVVNIAVFVHLLQRRLKKTAEQKQ
ncbi:solute carrier family 22 member 18 isoform X2 [Micropterus dolomieu]|uniref:solute carrier family 22 member 18 isoform X2 n=1 Tax=Micropterus dolomieu TaxID=147949 RepID=UPI001E8DE394|nr:solute carrier family 22 member 18 isoform X2 [Micropterus dolomieu]